MEKISTYYATFKHLGPIQIHIYKKISTVISILGINSFNFKYLPNNRDNKNAILKLSLKAYFNEHIENFDDLESLK